MKKVLSVITVVAVTALATSAMALSIVNSKHDLSSGSTATINSPNAKSNSANSNSTTQVCVFCHTPHNAAANKALWNRNGATATFAVYTSGIKLRYSSNPSWFENSSQTINNASPSYLCMTCHDGVTQMNALANPPLGTTSDNSGTVSGSATYKVNLGTALTDDHPISIDYVTVQAAAGLGSTNLVAPSGAGTLSANVAGLPLNKGKNLECSTCHNVHDNAKGFFLRMTVDGSALCTACHVK